MLKSEKYISSASCRNSNTFLINDDELLKVMRRVKKKREQIHGFAKMTPIKSNNCTDKIKRRITVTKRIRWAQRKRDGNEETKRRRQ